MNGTVRFTKSPWPIAALASDEHEKMYLVDNRAIVACCCCSVQ